MYFSKEQSNVQAYLICPNA